MARKTSVGSGVKLEKMALEQMIKELQEGSAWFEVIQDGPYNGDLIVRFVERE